MRILMLRHAPTAWNLARRIQGHIDLPLCPRGRQVAAGWHIDAEWRRCRCLSSPLRRARETAALLGLAEVRVEPRLREMHWGAFEGWRLSDLRRLLGERFDENEASGLDFRPPGGESPRQVMHRLAGLFGVLAGRPDDRLLVTHRGVLHAALALASGWDMRGPPPIRLEEGEGLLLELDPDGSCRIGGSLPLVSNGG